MSQPSDSKRGEGRIVFGGEYCDPPLDCPHCDGTADPLDNGPGEYWVECSCCHARTSLEDRPQAAIAIWNRRPSPPDVRPSVEGVPTREERERMLRDVNLGRYGTGFPNGFFKRLFTAIEVLELALAAAERERDRLREQTRVTMGVGDGTGRLFVYGPYDAIKKCQGIIDERDRLARENGELRQQLQHAQDNPEPPRWIGPDAMKG